jgi:hypothetical protein
VSHLQPYRLQFRNTCSWCFEDNILVIAFIASKRCISLSFFGNACTKSGPLRFTQFSGYWLILSCLLTYEFCLSLWKIARCSIILLLPLLVNINVTLFCCTSMLYCFINLFVLHTTYHIWYEYVLMNEI